MRSALLVCCLAGCYSPGIGDGQFTCEKSDSCPSGFQCLCHLCRPSGTTSCDNNDLGVGDLAGGDGASADLSTSDLTTRDLATVDLLPMASGCSSGPRSTNDPGHPNVALCPAAWMVPGINPSPATPCNHAAGMNGMSGATNCSLEDNCSTGWHVCTGDTDLTAKGFSSADCAALDNANSLWVTRQQGQPPMPSPGPPVCMTGVSHTVFGCGTLTTGAIGLTNCTIVRRALVNPPDSVDDCATNTGNAFLCGTATAPEATSVYKPARGGGGVICCHD